MVASCHGIDNIYRGGEMVEDSVRNSVNERKRASRYLLGDNLTPLLKLDCSKTMIVQQATIAASQQPTNIRLCA